MTYTLRPYQQDLITKSIEALNLHGNTLSIAPTGSGKTIMLSSIIGQLLQPNQQALVLQHRHELLGQNQTKFRAIHPELTTSLFKALEKDTSGQVIFAMAQTLSNGNNLNKIPTIGLLVIDEAHHTMAVSYLKIIKSLKTKNPNLKILGLTATPSRGDKQKLFKIFNNVADQIMLRDLIIEGHLVPPKTYAIDLGYNAELEKIFEGVSEANLESDANMSKACVVMNQDRFCQEAFERWKELAYNRQTVIFCTTVRHAKHMQEVFEANGIPCEHVNGKMHPFVRESSLRRFCMVDGTVVADHPNNSCPESNSDGSCGIKNVKVITNVAVLTEGWDYPPTSCVILLRPMSFKSTYIQMIGRGLRAHPGKSECIVLDFGLSTKHHGSLEQEILWQEEESNRPFKEIKKTKTCKECLGEIPIKCNDCPLCGANQQSIADTSIDSLKGELVMKEVDPIEASAYAWEPIDPNASICVGFNGFALLVEKNTGTKVYGAIKKDNKVDLLHEGSKQECLYHADAFIAKQEHPYKGPLKKAEWLNAQPTEGQLEYLEGKQVRNKYHATVLLTCEFNHNLINSCLYGK